MSNTPLKIGFLASGEIGLNVLSALASASDHIQICFVNTQVDRPSGRKQVLTPTPIAQHAEKLGLNLHKLNVNSPAFINLLESTQIEMLVVIDFGQILRTNILQFPRYGCINIHASLLPKYRGASPIQSAILNQEPFTGITFMKMDEGLDTGDIYMSFVIPLESKTPANQLLINLSKLAAKHVVKMITMITTKKMPPVVQDTADASVCKKIKKEHAYINFAQSARTLCARVYAYHPWPGVCIQFENEQKVIRARITQATCVETPTQSTPGMILDCGKKRIVIACTENAFEIDRLVPESKKEISAAEFLNGFPLKPGCILTPIAKN